MRIGIDALTLVPHRTGGVETYLRNLVRAFGDLGLRQAQHEADEWVVFCLPESKGLLTFGHPNVRIVTCRMPLMLSASKHGNAGVACRVLYEQLCLPRKIRKHSIDVMLFPANVSSLLCPCRRVLVVHDLISLYYAENHPGTTGRFKEVALPRLIEASARRADTVVTISEFTKREVVDRLGARADRIEVVYSGVDGAGGRNGQDALRQARGETPVEGPYILSVGYQHRHKNLDGLARAFALMKERSGLPHTLVIVGKEESGTPALQQELRSLGRKDILTLGRVSDEELPALYRGASLFVFPSLIEGFGLPILEAMAHGVPVASSNAGPMPEVAGDAAVLFDPLDTDAMADAMERVLTEHGLAERLRARGHARVGEGTEFSWDRTAERLLRVIRSVRGVAGHLP